MNTFYVELDDPALKDKPVVPHIPNSGWVS
jgi:hypothetical protein